MKTFDPTTLTADNLDAQDTLLRIINHDPSCCYFPAGLHYYLDDAGNKHQLNLTNGLVLRGRKKVPTDLHIEVLNPRPFSDCAYVNLYRSLGTIKFERQMSFFPHRKRVAKVYAVGESLNKAAPILTKFASKYQLFGLFHAKTPVSTKQNIVAVMNEMEGEELFVLLDDLSKPLANLTLIEQLELVRNLLLALDAFHQAGYVHGDIKSENILVNLKTLEVKIVDLDFLSPIGAPIETFRGTMGYMAPELLTSTNKKHHTTASDVYAMGVVISLLFDDSGLDEMDKLDDFNSAAMLDWISRRKIQLRSDLPPAVRLSLSLVLDSMLRFDPGQRGQLKDLLKSIESTIDRYRLSIGNQIPRPQNPVFDCSSNNPNDTEDEHYYPNPVS